VHLAGRVQGLIVPPGNPLGITRLEDLTREDVLFVNRQRGSGTRVLLDYRLRGSGINPRQIRGFEREEFTHLAVAAAVASGAASTGLGILAAARALELDFIPLFSEQYQLVIPRQHYESPRLAPLLDVLRSPEFRAQVDALGGYEVADMGRVVWEG
jgi:putative molybdopterin biosynthesis protein